MISVGRDEILSRLSRMPAVCYKLIINYTLRLHVKNFIRVRWDPFSILSGSRFANTKFFCVIASARLSGMKQ